MPTFSSLFTGGGLADIGALQSGYELLWGVEIDTDIAAVASANLKHQVYAASVIGFDWGSLAKPDHLHMSPPCQDFSVAKRQGTVSNPNDEIADACIEALSVLQPQTVTLENVEGYKRSEGFQRIVDHLWGSGYWVNVDVLNAANFGVPQTRRRLILRAVKGGIPGPLPQPVQWRGWYEAIEDLIPELPDSSFAPWQIERLEKLSDGSTWLVQRQPGARGDGVRAVCEPAKTYCGTDTEPRALLVDGISNKNGSTVTTVGDGSPSFAVKASSSKQASRASTTTGRVVRMTPRCLARFQSVPDWYVLPGKRSLACLIIGNGVPCLMMQRILESFEQSVDEAMTIKKTEMEDLDSV